MFGWNLLLVFFFVFFTHHLVNMLTLSDWKMSHLLYILTILAFTLIKNELSIWFQTDFQLSLLNCHPCVTVIWWLTADNHILHIMHELDAVAKQRLLFFAYDGCEAENRSTIMKNTNICFIILVRTSLRLPLILYQVNNIFLIA